MNTPSFRSWMISIAKTKPSETLGISVGELEGAYEAGSILFDKLHPAVVDTYDYTVISAVIAPHVTNLLDKPSACSLELLKPNGNEAVQLIAESESIELSFPYLDSVEIPTFSILNELKITETCDLFSPITRTSSAGASYGDHTEVKSTIQSALPDLEERCKHDLPKISCHICRTQEEQSRANQNAHKPTVDVFEFLLPYLYPPVGPEQPQQIIFPAGKEPYPYQWDGIQFLIKHDKALLADEMGLGKTIQVIVALRILFHQGRLKHVLVLCPKSLLGTWYSELSEWAPELSVQKISGSIETRELQWQSNSHLLLTSYNFLLQDVDNNNAQVNSIDGLVMDEVQKLKNPTRLMHKAALGVNANLRWGISGTPLENKVEDLNAVLSLLKLHILENIALCDNASVKKTIAPYMLRRRLSIIKDQLPEKQSREIWLELTTEQRHSYDSLEEALKIGLRLPTATRINALSAVTKLKQICNIEPISNSSCKLEYLIDQLEDVVESQQKALVFSQFPNATLRKIEGELKDFSPAIFDGSLSDKKRESLKTAFQNEEDPKVLLMSVQAGGLGLTLTRANNVFHYDHWWNPATYKQAEGRAYRIGQHNPVTIHHLYTLGTIEAKIYKVLLQRQYLFDSIIDDLSTEDIIGKLSDEDLFGLFGLTPPEKTSKKEDELNSLSPKEFEDLIKELYRKQGYYAEVTPQSRDGGVDVIARKISSLSQGEYILIQCKHYQENNVSVQLVRELAGVLSNTKEATGAVLVTNGKFTEDAKQFARQRSNLILIDGVQLRAELTRLKVPIKSKTKTMPA